MNACRQRDQVPHKELALEEEREAEAHEHVHLGLPLPGLGWRLESMGSSEGSGVPPPPIEGAAPPASSVILGGATALNFIRQEIVPGTHF